MTDADDGESSGRVNFVDLAADYDLLRDEINDAIQRVLDRGDFILGQDTTLFELEFAEYCATAFAVGVDSGFSALELLLRAFEVGPGDEVVTAANTFYSTVRSIEECGATPVLVDVDPISRTIDPSLIEPAMTHRTRAIVPVHLYGHPADMDAVTRIAEAHNVLVIEDACQAHGARHRGARAGSLGDGAAFSFYPSKNLGAFGDGGIAVTDRPEIDQRLRELRNLGSVAPYQHERRGFNRRLDSIQAAVLRVKLPHLDAANEARRMVARNYEVALADCEVALPQTAAGVEPVFHLYVVEMKNRDAVASRLAALGVPTGLHYPVPIHLQPAFTSLRLGRGDFPVTESLADRILSLPMHPHVTLEDVDRVADGLRRISNVA